MKIYYPTKSRFLNDCKNSIRLNRVSLLSGNPIIIKFSPKGYDGRVKVSIEEINSKSFMTNWTGIDDTRFPVRIKAAAYALYKEGCFGDFIISHKTGTLTIQLISSNEQNNVSNKDKIIQPTRIQQTKNTQNEKDINFIRIKKLIEILDEISWDTWEHIVKIEPEWKELKPFLQQYNYGAFAVLMITIGINDYQLKGKADVAYWPEIRRIVEKSPIPKSPKDLYTILHPFYQKERLPTQKLKRLRKIITSSLVKELWISSSSDVSLNFNEIWQRLAKILNQKPQDKTISFAMKCLGISLLMAHEYKFNFGSIPMPVDLRVVRFTKKTGIADTENPKTVRKAWNNVLSSLNVNNPDLTMIHLDSLIWQIASFNDAELLDYFQKIGIKNIGNHIISFSQQSASENKKTNNSQNTKRILILFPCSGRKNKIVINETFDEEEEKKAIDLITNTKSLLVAGRNVLTPSIKQESTPLSAIDRYNGFLYNNPPDFRNAVREAFYKQNIHILILSGAYGILTPSERIFDYNKQINAKHWNEFGLPEVIHEYIVQNNITHVFGFFSISTDYMKIMNSINWSKVKKDSNIKIARTYYVNFKDLGGAQVIVPQTTGSLIYSFIKSNFDQERFFSNPFQGQQIDFIDHIVD